MTEADRLTFSYLEEHPEEAARVLEALELEDAAALLASVPTRLGAPVLSAVLPPRAALYLDSLNNNLALALLGRMKARDGVSIIRYLPAEKRSRFISNLPTGRALAYRLLLGYPEETVGAWVDPEVLVFQPLRTAGEALSRFRQSSRLLPPFVYVVSEDRRLLGGLSLQELVAAPADSRLDQLMKKISRTLPAPSLLRNAVHREDWQSRDSIPVVEKGNRFIGVLHHSTLRVLLARQSVSPGKLEKRSAVAAAGAAYWQLVSSLIELLIDLLPGGSLERGNRENGKKL
ncbi:MAG: magnesium transporter MgtE N-terminal domain-containing protein [Desulfurivibrionaceae bacterium]